MSKNIKVFISAVFAILIVVGAGSLIAGLIAFIASGQMPETAQELRFICIILMVGGFLVLVIGLLPMVMLFQSLQKDIKRQELEKALQSVKDIEEQVTAEKHETVDKRKPAEECETVEKREPAEKCETAEECLAAEEPSDG